MLWVNDRVRAQVEVAFIYGTIDGQVNQTLIGLLERERERSQERHRGRLGNGSTDTCSMLNLIPNLNRKSSMKIWNQCCL